MLKSKAWQALSGNAIKLLLEVWMRYDGKNNGEISFAVREAARALGCSINYASKLFKELQKTGFLKISKKGSFNYKKRHATEWILTAEPVGDAQATKDFMSWTPPEPEQKKPVACGETDSSTRKCQHHSETVEIPPV